MELTVLKYALSADNRDVEALNQVFHENFRVNVLTDEGMMSLDKVQYLESIKAGKIGGVEREVKIQSIEDDEIVGFVKLTLESNKVIFYDNITLVKEKKQWQIISNMTRLVSK